jgi:hypothetical protein
MPAIVAAAKAQKQAVCRQDRRVVFGLPILPNERTQARERLADPFLMDKLENLRTR